MGTTKRNRIKIGWLLAALMLFVSLACGSSETPPPTVTLPPQAVPPTLPALGDVITNPPEVTIPSTSGATLSGVVWHDECRLQANGSPSSGCVPDALGGYRADGVFNNEETRIAGVQVTLRAGQCPGSEPVAAPETTGANGAYRFTGLQASSYCVQITPQNGANQAVLLPGDWTYPAPGQGSHTVTLTENQPSTADFGWDFQSDPEPAPSSNNATPTSAPASACQDQAAYVADVTIPDGTVVAPGETFVKTWRVRNTGTCAWGPAYALAFDSGDQLGGPNATPLQQQVRPGAEADLSVTLVAPLNSGTYVSNWLLRNPQGELFGSRGNFPFYAEVVVQAAANNLAPPTVAAPSSGVTIRGMVWADACRVLTDGTPSAGCIADELGGYRADGLLNNGEARIPGVQVMLRAGQCSAAGQIIETVTTDQNGQYQFTNLVAGPHCIAINPRTGENTVILLPGEWTHPAPGVGSVTVLVGTSERQSVNFGWDYQLR